MDASFTYLAVEQRNWRTGFVLLHHQFPCRGGGPGVPDGRHRRGSQPPSMLVGWLAIGRSQQPQLEEVIPHHLRVRGRGSTIHSQESFSPYTAVGRGPRRRLLRPSGIGFLQNGRENASEEGDSAKMGSDVRVPNPPRSAVSYAQRAACVLPHSPKQKMDTSPARYTGPWLCRPGAMGTDIHCTTCSCFRGVFACTRRVNRAFTGRCLSLTDTGIDKDPRRYAHRIQSWSWVPWRAGCSALSRGPPPAPAPGWNGRPACVAGRSAGRLVRTEFRRVQ
jgi:hypothetical protein